MTLILSFALSFAIFTALHADMDTTIRTQKAHDVDLVPKYAGKWTIPRPDSSGCAKEFSCVIYGKQTAPGVDCNGPDCSYMLAYRPPSAGGVELFLATQKSQYVAVGFTPNLKVNPVCVVCTRTKNNSVAYSLLKWTESGFMDITPSDKKEMEGLDSNVENGGFWCLIRLSALNNKPINMGASFYQLYFHGEVDDSGKPKLVGESEKKPQHLNTSSFALPLGWTLNTMHMIFNHGMDLSDIDCSVFNCVGIRVTRLKNKMSSTKCDYSNCSYLLAYDPKTQPSQLILSSTDAQFIAVGFTKDLQNQTNTEVIGCKTTTEGRITAFSYWFSNPSQKDQRLTQSRHTFNTVKFNKGSLHRRGLWCIIERPVEPGGRALSLNTPVYLLYMWGSLDENGEPDIWNTEKNFNSTEEKILSTLNHWTTFTTVADRTTFIFVASSSVNSVSWIVSIVVITLTLSVHL